MSLDYRRRACSESYIGRTYTLLTHFSLATLKNTQVQQHSEVYLRQQEFCHKLTLYPLSTKILVFSPYFNATHTIAEACTYSSIGGGVMFCTRTLILHFTQNSVNPNQEILCSLCLLNQLEAGPKWQGPPGVPPWISSLPADIPGCWAPLYREDKRIQESAGGAQQQEASGSH